MTNKRIELPALSDEQIAQVAYKAWGYDGEGFKEVHAADIRWLARCLIAAHEQARVVGEPVARGVDGMLHWEADYSDLPRDVPLYLASPPAPQEAQADVWHPTTEEQADGNRGIRWVHEGKICGRPSAHDVREYLIVRGDNANCTCPACTTFYAAPVAQPATEPRSYEDLLTPENLRAWGHPVAQPATEPRPLTQDEHEVMRAAQRSSGVVVHPGRLATEQAEAPSDTAREVLAAGIVHHYGVPEEMSFACARQVLDLATQPTASNAGERDIRELLRRARGYVEDAAKRYYDGTDGEATRRSARYLLLQIDRAALASKPVAPPAREVLTDEQRLEWAVWRIQDLEKRLAVAAAIAGGALSATTPAPAGQKS